MKATPSKDGEMRFGVTIKRRVGLDEIVDALGWNLIRSDRDWFNTDNKAMAVESELKAYRSRKKTLDATIKAYLHDGESVWVWADDCSFSEIVREQARVLVLKKFPELKVKQI